MIYSRLPECKFQRKRSAPPKILDRPSRPRRQNWALSLVGLPKIRLRRPLQALKLDLALSLPQLTLSPSWPCDHLLSNYKCEDSPQLCWRSQCDHRLDPHVEMVAATIGLVCCIRLRATGGIDSGMGWVPYWALCAPGQPVHPYNPYFRGAEESENQNWLLDLESCLSYPQHVPKARNA